MREARDWFAVRFNPDTVEDVFTVLEGPQSAFFRMVVSYWDMAASLVNHGALDEQLFADATAEHIVAFAKIEPFLADLRARVGNPRYLAQLEQLVMRLPNAPEQLAQTRARFRELAKRSGETTGLAEDEATQLSPLV